MFNRLSPSRMLAAALATATLGLSACGGTEDPPVVTPPVEKVARGVLATSNPAGRGSDKLVRLDAKLTATQSTFADIDVVTSIQSVTIDTVGDGYVTFDGRNMTGGISVYAGLRDQAVSAALGGGARTIYGAKTNLVAPKGIIVANTLNLIIVADFGAKNIKTYPIAADGDVAPSNTIALGDATRSVWDIHYDAGADILFASGTDGVILAYDMFGQNKGATGPSRTITPTGFGNAKISVNLHGIAYDRTLDLIIVSDVGDTASATDGQIISVGMGSTAMGNTLATVQMKGGMTGLGNPVDIYFEGANLYVAEKSNNTVLRFDAFGTAVGALEGMANVTLSVPKVESIALASRGGIGGGALLVTTNPDMIESDAIVQIPFTLTSSPASFGNIGIVTSIENVTVGANGEGYVSFDSGPNGGVMLLDGLDDDTSSGTLGIGDGLLFGPLTTLKAPKGIDASGSNLIVADFGAKAIKVFAKAAGNTAPLFATTNLGAGSMRSVWDVQLDVAGDRLYAAGTDGTLLVYDAWSVNKGAAGPTRTIKPMGSVNLHGVAYDKANDLVYLSDVGDAMSATDGQLFVIANASTAGGDAVAAQANIKGPLSKLGNPVDIALDGKNLFVAEKSNDAILRFDGVAALMGSSDTAAAASNATVKPESVFVIPAAQ